MSLIKVKKYLRPLLVTGALVSFNIITYCQVDQSYSDSLKVVLESDDLPDSSRMNFLIEIAHSESDPSEIIFYGNKLLELSRGMDSSRIQQLAELFVGNGYKFLGNLDVALEHYYLSAKLAESLGDENALGQVFGSIGSVHRQNKDYLNAIRYYSKSLELFQDQDDTLYTAITFFNLGNTYYQMRSLDSAMRCFERSSLLARFIEHKMLNTYSKGSMSLILLKQSDSGIGEQKLRGVLRTLDSLGDKYGMADYLFQLSEIYGDKEKYDLAINTSLESLFISKELGLKEQIRDASYNLFKLYKKNHQFENALMYHEQYTLYKDSITNMESVQEMADLRTEYEVGQKQAELDLVNAQRRIERIIMIAITVLAIIMVVLALIIFKYYRSKARVNAILESQKETLENQKQELIALNETKDKFFSIISHDLRGPVSSFFGISRMIKYLVKSKETNQLLEIADDIDQSVERLSNLLDNLLSWATQQHGHIPYVPEKIVAKNLADDIVKTLTNMAKGKDISLQAEVEEETELWADRNTTMTIIRNLVNNSLKFTPEGGSVTVRAWRENDQAIIEVSDTGVGISAGKLENIFELQDKKSTYGTSGEKGLGLGLQLVQEFVILNQGQISVTSEEGKGTTFTVALPIYTEVQEEYLQVSQGK